jgi:hypothetical protein
MIIQPVDYVVHFVQNGKNNWHEFKHRIATVQMLNDRELILVSPKNHLIEIFSLQSYQIVVVGHQFGKSGLIKLRMFSESGLVCVEEESRISLRLTYYHYE